MPGGFDDGFDLGFGPVHASGSLSDALLVYLGILRPQEITMESLIISGATASGVITPGPGQGIQVEAIELDVPLDEVGTTDPIITLSGSISGATSFHSSVTPKLRFYQDEAVYLTSTDFTAEYSAIVKYVTYGSQEEYLNSRNMSAIPLPSRLTRRTPRSS